MPHITTTDRPVYFAASASGSVIHTGLIDTGGACGTPLAVDYDPDENAFLGKVAGKAASYNPLPAAGAQLQAGEIYGYGGGLVIVRQSHTRTEHAPADVPALFSVYRAGGGVLEWVANEPVTVGIHRAYGGGGVCLHPGAHHANRLDAPAVPALWAVYTAPSSSWAVGVAYKVNDVVTYQGKQYRCLQAHTSQAGWTPTAVPALWQVIP